MTEIVMYTKKHCPYCHKAKDLLDQKHVYYYEIEIDDNPVKREEMITKSGRHTVPQIFINGNAIGGCDDLYALNQQGQLDELLKH